jgi:transcription-repair coupling factor (superfamily II helicase)
MNVSVGIEEKKEFNQFYEYYETMDQNKLLIEIKEDLK